MEDVDWTPKGGDGASTDGPSDVLIDDAIATFVKVAAATAIEAHEVAQIAWSGFVERVGDIYNPYAVYVHGGILMTAIAVRAYCGDLNPTGPPSSGIDVMTVARKATTGEFVDLDAANVAGEVISHACAWEWEKVNDLMATKVEEAPDSDFLQEMGDVLTQVFIGVSGIGNGLKQS